MSVYQHMHARARVHAHTHTHTHVNMRVHAHTIYILCAPDMTHSHMRHAAHTLACAVTRHPRRARVSVAMSYMTSDMSLAVSLRPTQSIMYVPLQVNRSQKCILLIVQYKYIKSCSGDFYFPESDPPHKIMRYWVYYSTQLCFGFPPDRICQVEMICIGGVPVLKMHFGGAGP